MTPDQAAVLTAVAELAETISLVGLLMLFSYLMLTDRLNSKGRLQREIDRADRAETQRDEAIAIGRDQTDAVKELAGVQRETLQYVRDAFMRRGGSSGGW